ncbi:MAG: NADH-quinone oxidoreductase subunit M [Verrucomicrobiales bacterium]|nr:NADH-quinone oxidoreductase subunit M [Verrucomicrobiales bacterium]
MSLPAWTIYLPFLGMLVLLLWPGATSRDARRVALVTMLLAGGAAFLSVLRYNPDAGWQEIVRLPWIPQFGIEYHLAMDGISACLLLLTAVASVVGVLFSWNIEHRTRAYFAFYLALIGGVYGVFLSRDLFLLFVFYEIAIIPKYFLIAIWGSTRREYGAMKLVLYSFVGSAVALVGMLAILAMGWRETGTPTMDLGLLARIPWSGGFQAWVFPLVFVGFGFLAGMWPFHSWAPTGHVAAPTPVSMLLAGVIMKLGAYGALRVGVGLFPAGVQMWQGTIALLAVCGILYGALVALVQQDFKFVIGFSSVSHMGFVILGLVTLNRYGLGGAVVQMFSHGILAGLLFGVVGRMVYDRTHTRQLPDLERMHLNRVLPFAAWTFVLAGVASMGLPGFSGFVAEMFVLVGAWSAFPLYAIATGVGILVGVAYTLRAVRRAFFADAGRAVAEAVALEHPLPPITWPEKIGAVVLLAASLMVGLNPDLLFRYVLPGVDGMLGVMAKGGGL